MHQATISESDPVCMPTTEFVHAINLPTAEFVHAINLPTSNRICAPRMQRSVRHHDHHHHDVMHA